jgi:hypothetical protein
MRYGTRMGNCREQESAANEISISTEKRKVCGIEVHKAFIVAPGVDRKGKSERIEFSRPQNRF